MAGGKATLVAWSLVGDLPVDAADGARLQAEGRAARRARRWRGSSSELARIKAHIAEQNLKIVRTPADVDLALKGDPHVVLSVEGASFLDDGLAQLQAAYDQGIRHIQLVHYIRTRSATSRPSSPSTTGCPTFGKKVVQECNRLGILVDLAHCTSGGDAGAGHLQSADGVVAQLGDADPQAALDRCPCAGPATEPGEAQGHRGQGRRGRPVGAALRRRRDARRPTPTGCRRWPTGWARTTSPSAPT